MQEMYSERLNAIEPVTAVYIAKESVHTFGVLKTIVIKGTSAISAVADDRVVRWVKTAELFNFFYIRMRHQW